MKEDVHEEWTKSMEPGPPCLLLEWKRGSERKRADHDHALPVAKNCPAESTLLQTEPGRKWTPRLVI